MIEFVSNIFCICVSVIIIGCTVVLVIFGCLLILWMLEESGVIDFLIELRNHKDSA